MTVTRVRQSDDYYPHVYPLPSEYVNDIMATEAERWAVLASMGIDRPSNETISPLAAWRDAVADESGIDRAQLDPTQGGVLDLGFSPIDVRHFVFYLA